MTPCNTDNDNEQQIEYASVKFLLKQVYSAHINKVKGLEEELQAVKAELEITKRTLNDAKSDCKQCKELQNAFTICKAALVEQTRCFENIGQKLSHSKDQSSRLKGEGLSEIEDSRPSSSIFSKPGRFTKTLENTVNNSELKEINFEKFSELFTPSEMQSLEVKPQKLRTSSTPKKLEQTIRTTDESSQMSHLLGVTDGRSNLSCDATNRSGSFVLVPDSLDCISGANVERQIINKSRSKNSPPKLNFAKQIPLDRSKTNSSRAVNVKSPKKNKSSTSKKRTLSDFLDGDAKTKKRKSGEGNRVSSPNAESDSNRNEKLVNLNMSTASTFFTIPNLIKDTNKTEVLVVVGKKASPREKKLKKSAEKIPSQDKVTRKGSHIKALNIQIVSDKAEKKQEDPKTDLICLDENDSKDSCGLNSQNLMLSKTSQKVKSFLTEENSNDNDDFQSAVTSASYPNDSNVSKSSVKKKLTKKTNHSKMLKCSSKYKMTLDAPSLNYNKPNYKQTKLTKTVFGAKKRKETTPSKGEKSKLVHEIFMKSKRTQSMDFDATCIPENFKYAATQHANSVLGDIGNIHKSQEVIISSNEELLPSKNYKESLSQDLLANVCFLAKNSPYIVDVAEDDDDGDEKIASENVKQNLNNTIGSFDKLPVPVEPNYKYKEDTVRNRVQRKQLNAFDCEECEKYYSELGLTDSEKQDRLKQCSRHRAKFAPPPTPEHFWELEFPDTQECKVRGYQAETQKVQLKTRRRRPLA